MLFKIAIQDYIEFIKKNKVLFFLVSIGLFSISFLSLLLFDTIRYNFLRDITYEGNHGFMYVYDEPISGKDLYKNLNKLDLSICSVYFASEQSHLNDPETTETVFETRNFVYNSGKITDVSEIGIIGYADSLFQVRSQNVYQGRFFNFTDSGKMVAIINNGFSHLENDGHITAEGYSFKIIGKTSSTTGQYLYDKCNVLIPLKTFAKLDVGVKVVQVNFKIPPTSGYIDKMTEILESFGANKNNNENIGVFTFSIITAVVQTSLLQIIALVFMVLILILVFKCWINSQQTLYKIYSICGISDIKLLFLRYIQVGLLFVPMYTVASIGYIGLILSNYKTFVYNLLPHTFILNFILSFSILTVMITVQNRRNTGYEVLNHI